MPLKCHAPKFEKLPPPSILYFDHLTSPSDLYFVLLQVTFDVAWSPDCIDSRCYDYSHLAEVTDFLIVMSYDERSQIYGPCIAGPNSAITSTFEGTIFKMICNVLGDVLTLFSLLKFSQSEGLLKFLCFFFNPFPFSPACNSLRQDNGSRSCLATI